MRNQFNEVSREELYEDVWNTPMWILAKKYSLSDRGLKKVCDKMDIPTPGNNYWSTKHNRIKLKKKLLPPQLKTQKAHYFYPQDQKPQFEINLSFFQKNSAQLDLSKSISVPKTLTGLPPELKDRYEQLKQKSADKYGVIHDSASGIRVSPENLKRAFKILKTIYDSTFKLGFRMSFPEKEGFRSFPHIFIDGQTVEFCIYEKTNESKVKKAPSKYYDTGYEYIYTPSGTLSLKIEEYLHNNVALKKQWSDRESALVDRFLPNFVETLIKVAAHKYQRQLKGEIEKKQKEVEAQRIEDLRKDRLREEARIRELEEQAIAWRKYKDLMVYIKEVEERSKSLDNSSDYELLQKREKWLVWAKAHAERINPFFGGYPFGSK